ncbi:ROK family protein [Microbacterium hydrocarbonoxydans]|uniref:ROK family protein n=1 Tax=Microbacterium hydrocarbonoxydans TaxID=273678 RepID=UPI00203FD7E9|nr:ROK family protein [Microbacterium hydrocarbonoxydans]MCM3781257.1 ROK family protein [Microbacterium hydrocarbonoxydans]
MTEDFRVGIDLGGTGTRVALVASDGSVVDRLSYATATGRAFAVRGLIDAVRSVIGTRQAVSIGIGASGPVDRAGIIRNPATLPAFTGVDLRAVLREEFDVPVAIDNDAVAAAVYESKVGAAAGAESLLMVTLGTGVGVAALSRGRPVRGADGEHPEAGHRFIEGKTAACYCGRSSCWEQAVSRTALQSAAETTRPEGSEPSAALSDLAARARDGDDDARSIFAEFGRLLGAGLADLQTVFRVDAIVVGGSASQFADLIGESARREFRRLETYRSEPALAYSRAGEFGGAVGAALLHPRWSDGS